MKKISIALVLIFSGSFLSHAQTDPLYAQYLSNPILINPAYTGLNNNFNASASYRKQWAGFEGSPVSYNVNTHSSLVDNKMGAGIMIVKDEIGENSNTEVHLTYSYKLQLENSSLSFGLQGGFVKFKSNSGELTPYDPTDPAFLGNQTFTKPSVGAGLILSNERYFVGISVPRMLKTNAVYNDVETELYSRHYYASASYVIFVNERLRLKPSALVRGVKGAPVSADINMALNIDEKYTLGAFSRDFNTYGFLVQMSLGEKYRVGYVFEVPSNKSVGTRFTSHELMFGIRMPMLPFQTSSISTF